MSNTPALISIEQIAASYANSKGQYGKAELYRYLQILIEGAGEYAIFDSNSLGKINWYAGTVDTTGCIDLPVDLIDYVRIGTPVNGQIVTLTRNDNLDLPIGMECGEVTGVDITGTVGTQPLYYNWLTVDYSATGGWNFMYYRFDKANRRIVFKGDSVGRQIVIEYISTGISLSGDTWIPRELMQLLKLYLNWQIKLYSDDKNVEYAAREFCIEKQRLRNFQWSFRKDEFLDMIYSTYTRAVKR